MYDKSLQRHILPINIFWNKLSSCNIWNWYYYVFSFKAGDVGVRNTRVAKMTCNHSLKKKAIFPKRLIIILYIIIWWYLKTKKNIDSLFENLSYSNFHKPSNFVQSECSDLFAHKRLIFVAIHVHDILEDKKKTFYSEYWFLER